jgi:hypothetical protein
MISEYLKSNRKNTALASKLPSIATRLASEKGFIKETILDWGAGKGRDTKWLQNNGITTIQFDPYYNPLPRIEDLDFRKINTILLIYVLNVIEVIEERIELIKEIKRRAYNGTFVIISVRTEKEITSFAKKSKWKNFGDGFITGKKTFQKGFNSIEFNNLCSSLGKIIDEKETNSYLFSVVKIEK